VHYFGAGAAITEVAPDALRDHRLRFGPRPTLDGDELIQALADARLTGRGGAHLPSAIKWRAVRSTAHPDGPLIVGNGAESEPDSRKDAALLEFRPHLVLDGLVAAATALGATEAVLWLHEGASTSRAAVSRALAERSDEVAVRIAVGPDRYLTGESSAIVRALSGGPVLPSFHVRPAAVSGVAGRPTLLHNVETLARVALVARGFVPDTSLLTVVSGEVRVVVESPVSAELHDVVGRVSDRPPEAVLLGGYGGRWCAWSDLAGARLAEQDLRARGLSLGAGVVSVLPPGTCGLARTAELAAYLAGEGARQCGPCRFGLPAVAESLALLVRGGRRSRHETARLATFLAEIHGRGACGHPDGAVRMVASALSVFAEDVAAHRRGRCLSR
jgi:NADH:ubiquinone oxidoreductase subunit F (NADH-binding)